MKVLDDMHATDGGESPPLLTSTLLTTLDRTPPEATQGHVWQTFVLGLATAGLGPAWINASCLRTAVRWRRDVLGHVADWARLDGKAGDEAKDHAAKVLALAAQAVALAAGLAAVMHLVIGEPLWRLWLVDPFRGSEPKPPQMAFLGLIGLSFLLTWVGANLHGRSGLSFVRHFDEATWKSPKAWDFGMAIVPTTAAIVLAYTGITWALPMAVSVVALRRIVTRTDRQQLQRLGVVLRGRVRDKRPKQAVPAMVGRARHCPHEDCRAELPVDATFCPRCGRVTPTTEALG